MRTLNTNGRLHPQCGITLIIVMIALVSLSLAALALIRSIDTGTLVMGNLGFKQAATAQTDSAVETAMAWLSNKLGNAPTDLYQDRCSSGCTNGDATSAYYATSLDALDIPAHTPAATRVLVDWENNGCSGMIFTRCIKPSPSITNNGFVSSYIIARMCKTTGDPNDLANNCAQPTAGGSVSLQINKGEIKYGKTTMLTGGGGGGANSILMFRIVARTQGPRNTVSYTETYVNSVSN